MDYRLQTVLDMARQKAEREKVRALNYRTASTEDPEANHELTIATAAGAQSAYDWTVGQLETFDIEVAGGPPPAQAPVYDLTAERTDNTKLREQLNAVIKMCKEATRQGNNYGWYDAQSYIARAQEQCEAALVSLL